MLNKQLTSGKEFSRITRDEFYLISLTDEQHFQFANTRYVCTIEDDPEMDDCYDYLYTFNNEEDLEQELINLYNQWDPLADNDDDYFDVMPDTLDMIIFGYKELQREIPFKEELIKRLQNYQEHYKEHCPEGIESYFSILSQLRS